MWEQRFSMWGLLDESCPGSWQRDVLSRQLHDPYPVGPKATGWSGTKKLPRFLKSLYTFSKLSLAF
ncbi:hypothetical protein BBI11_10715 [Planococcus maritimus]|nr:hypothetical protein BBI11_10715 [Planococcus maritimus]